MSELEAHSDLFLTPHGLLRIESLTCPSPWPEPEASHRVAKVLGENPAQVLLHLATRELNTLLPPSAAWWREFGRRYLTQLCHLPGPLSRCAGPPPFRHRQKLSWRR